MSGKTTTRKIMKILRIEIEKKLTSLFKGDFRDFEYHFEKLTTDFRFLTKSQLPKMLFLEVVYKKRTQKVVDLDGILIRNI